MGVQQSQENGNTTVYNEVPRITKTSVESTGTGEYRSVQGRFVKPID
jgi:hypothetical protein